MSKKLSSAALEAMANELLYGCRVKPRAQAGGFQYLRPKKSLDLKCDGCSRPRSWGTASLCRACYRARAQKKLGEVVHADSYAHFGGDVGFDGEERVRTATLAEIE